MQRYPTSGELGAASDEKLVEVVEAICECHVAPEYRLAIPESEGLGIAVAIHLNRDVREVLTLCQAALEESAAHFEAEQVAHWLACYDADQADQDHLGVG